MTLFVIAMVGVVLALHGLYLGKQLREIHVLVNSRLEESLLRIRNLERALILEPGEAAPRAGSRGERAG